MKAGIVVFPGINRERDMAIALEHATGTSRAWSGIGETDAARPRSGGAAGRLQLRRLSALRRDGGAFAGDARGPRLRRRAAATCWASATAFRSWPRRACCPARCCAMPALRFLSADCHLRVERSRHGVRRPLPARPGVPRAAGAWRRQLLRRRRDARPAGGRGTGGVPLRHARPARRRRKPSATAAPATSPASTRTNLRVLGLMPHPEDLVDPLMGGTDGKPLFDGLAASPRRVNAARRQPGAGAGIRAAAPRNTPTCCRSWAARRRLTELGIFSVDVVASTAPTNPPASWLKQLPTKRPG